MVQQWNEIPAPGGKEAVSRTYGVAYRTDVIDVRVRGNGGQLEYMIKMNAGDALVYSWEVPGVADPQAFLTEFHGHTEPVGGRGDLMFYEKGPGAKANGSLGCGLPVGVPAAGAAAGEDVSSTALAFTGVLVTEVLEALAGSGSVGGCDACAGFCC